MTGWQIIYFQNNSRIKSKWTSAKSRQKVTCPVSHMSSADPELLSSHLIWLLLLPLTSMLHLRRNVQCAMHDVQCTMCLCMCIVQCSLCMCIVQCAFSKFYSMCVRAVRGLTSSFKLKDHQSLPQIKPTQRNQCNELNVIDPTQHQNPVKSVSGQASFRLF